jgi:GNAT superfamily N-acetyltransferase
VRLCAVEVFGSSTQAPGWKHARVSTYRTVVGDGSPGLDARLSDELDRYNAAATPGTDSARELTVQILDDSSGLVAGLSGWTWGVVAGIGMTWVRDDARGTGVDTRLLDAFEATARERGCRHVFVTSFTFQAPGFYERHGCVELARWQDVPVAGTADVHLRKDLTA